MRELHRVLKPGGWVIVMVPLDTDRLHTYEDASITSAEEREREFRQSDHVRLYAPDIAHRLTAAGFDVTTERVAHDLGPQAAARHRLLADDHVFLCR
jgi:hypothetical protein